MIKIVSGLAAAALISALSFAAPARAAEQRADGASTAQRGELTEFSSHRTGYRHRHYPRRVYRPRAYAYPYAAYPYPYYYPYGYYRPYGYWRRPGVYFGFRF
jgi:hypothetical protein